MYAVIKTGGKQYKVEEGDVIFVEKLKADEGGPYVFDQVLIYSDDDQGTKVGTPTVEGASVEAKVISHGKEKKVVVFKFKAKKDYRRKSGHRQPYTKLQIMKIVG